MNKPNQHRPPGVRIVIPSNSEFVRVVRLAVLGVASRMSFSFEDIEDIKLAVSEACNNAIIHARTTPALQAQTVMEVEVGITPYPDRLEIEVSDRGQVPPPGLRAQGPHGAAGDAHEGGELRESGLGLFLMESLMDSVNHETSADLNTIVHMVKYLPGADSAAGLPATRAQRLERAADKSPSTGA